ncbi:laccase [Russula ochroleuca]|uniref:Laccase n=1 Tax=Russula ochroleuca TaxID=152965 RepID=A0A9P5MQH9_9AGAM|nr:laccase [Russula ochroleuca]
MIRLFSLAVIVATLSGIVSAVIGPFAVLPIVNAIIAPDGHSRHATLAGGTFPGPLITGNKGDHFKIKVTNELVDQSMDLVTSIHWHGLFQKDTNYADGAAFVTQCPIVPFESFLYQFNTEEQAGTYWYHSHFQAQYCDGLRGPLVIYDPNDPHLGLYDVDDESTVITLADWYHYVSTVAPLITEPDSTLINGKGRYKGGPPTAFEVVNVVHGERYRLRLVSISCEPAYKFSVDRHSLTIIEVDGINVKPLEVDSLQIFAGQRYSVVLNANQPIKNYWIRALPNYPVQDYSNYTNVAILRYSSAPISSPQGDPNKDVPQRNNPLKETNLHPLDPNPVPGKPFPGGADITINLDVGFTLAPEPAYLVNNATFTSPSIPVLLQILSGKRNASDLLPKGTIYGLEAGKSVEISIPAGAPGGPHPMHLHGHSFHVVRSAGNSTYNFDNPIIRDVVSIGDPGDNVTIRFFTDNPGPWFLHCHIDWHLERGFAVVFAEDVPDVASQVKPTVDWGLLCPAYNQFNPKEEN